MSKQEKIQKKKLSAQIRHQTKEGSYSACHFHTAIGECALIWNEQEQICGFFLPEAQIQLLKKRIRQWPAVIVARSKEPRSIRILIKKIENHLNGKLQDFSQVKISLNRATEFQRKIYSIVKTIPPSEVCSYKDLGQALGGIKAFRAIGSAMGKNPIPLIVPCHRVVGSGKSLGGFTAHGGIKTKLKLLSIEGVID